MALTPYSRRNPILAKTGSARLPEAKTLQAAKRLDQIIFGLNSGALRDKCVRNFLLGPFSVRFYFPEVRLAVDVIDDRSSLLGFLQEADEQPKRQAIRRADIIYLPLCPKDIDGDRDELVDRLRKAWKEALQAIRAANQALHERKLKSTAPIDSTIQKKKKSISKARQKSTIVQGGWTSLSQGKRKVGDQNVADYKRYIDEGIAGTRNEVRAARSQIFADLRKRSRGD